MGLTRSSPANDAVEPLVAGRDARTIFRPPVSLPRVLAAYALLAALPYLLGLLSTEVDHRNLFTETVTIASMAGMAILLIQFALSGRLHGIAARTGVDHGLRIHRKGGELLALLFFLHPLLIVLPRAWVSGRYAPSDLWLAFVSPLTSTGFYAWSLLIVWVLMAMFRDRLPLRYEAWRVSHGLGAIVIAILATDHVITVGRHGYHPKDAWLDWVWIGLCAAAVLALVDTYLVRPLRIARAPFRVVAAERISRSDWCLTLEQQSGAPFVFDAGQFVWLNTSGSPFTRSEHPFSIASAPSALPYVSFIVRERGDYTGAFVQLRPGQAAWLEGPQGSFTLSGRNGKGVGLIATGAGIGPVLGILRQLHDTADPRPVCLVYGNTTQDQMVCQDEIAGIAERLDFRQIPALTRPPAEFCGHRGRIDAALLDKVFDDAARAQWDYFICGSPQAVTAIVSALRGLGVARRQLVFEQLSF